MVSTLENELKHYGVLGMKWGVRNDDRPKTPEQKAEEKQAKRNKRAEKYVQRAKAYKDRISELDGRKKKNFFTKRERASLVKDMNRALSDAEKKRKGKLSSGQRNLVIGGSVVAALVAAGVTASLIQSGEGRRLIEKGKAALTGKEFKFKRDESLKTVTNAEDIMEKIVKKVNPDFGEIGTKMNCRRATMAYELRRRGYDVMATRTTTADGQTTHGLLNVLKPGRNSNDGVFANLNSAIKEGISRAADPSAKTEFLDVATGGPGGSFQSILNPNPSGSKGRSTRTFAIDHLLKALAKDQPNGARGEVSVMWDSGGGHSMAYEIIDGIANIFDNQTGKRYFIEPDGFVYDDLPNINMAGFTRLDNVEMNLDFLMKWVRNA